MRIPNILTPPCQISNPHQVTTFMGNNNLYGILKFDQIISFRAIVFKNDNPQYKQTGLHQISI